MLMKESKILEITKTKERENEHGKLFYITLRLENGEYITLGKKKVDAFKIGDTIKYEKIWENKRKEIRPAFSPKGGWISNKQIAAIGAAILTAGGKSDFKTSADTILNWLEA